MPANQSGQSELVFADLAELYEFRVTPGFVGRSAFVTEEDAWYEAMRVGLGSECWRPSVGVVVEGNQITDVDDGLDITDGTLSLVLAEGGGLSVDGDGLAAAVATAGDGLDITDGELTLALDAAGGLAADGDGLTVVVAEGGGLALDEDGLSIDVDDAAALIGRVFAYRRVLAFDDPDIDVGDPSMTITFPVLPAGAVLTGVSLDVGTAFTDGGGEGTSDPWGLQMTLPDGETWQGDLSTTGLTGDVYALPASGELTMVLEPTGEADLSALSAGAATVTLYFVIPAVTIVPPVEAP